ncbi:hypothetical protein HMPREF0765_1369 [Sphingobacterium spiritivorum ATCC 33300]|uniref:DoxX family protein n=1 Tax=Sphingobacterium spiritivorum ATCC 33300 TaxID=525372 RepID=C2FVL3_SPHSI|nr:hypothetical protein [Sphingobacterium spiritivorum]EEI93071.1 hypothetical protein HMPREF0765_1369 [Sphingobacterium spiritivorum ATCC 33300]QQS96214.1 hypothetical protein I6J03_00455 [Sphingobacterium spiritivorum]
MRNRKISTIQHIARIALGLFLLFAGIGHLSFARLEFRAQVPPWVPMDVDLVVILSGIAEIGLALLILIWGHRKNWIPWFVALFFIAVFPGNIAQYTEQRDAFGLNTDGLRLFRLFMQPVLIIWALWSMDAFHKRKHSLRRQYK